MLSEWMYYVLLILLGARLGSILAVGVNWRSAWKKYIVVLCSVLAPFAIGFAEHPIYEDAVSESSDDMRMVKTMPEYAGVDLVVITIPDCPYCKRATQDMLLMHKRKPELKMRMVVCTSDSTWVQPYVELAQGAFEVVKASDMDVMATHANGHFPSFVLVENNSPLRRWSNNQWGPIAKDEVERGEG